MRAPYVIHRLAIIALFAVMVMAIVNAIRLHVSGPTSGLAHAASFGGAGLWGICIMTIWFKPRTWSLAVGAFAFLILGFQINLWRLGVANPRLAPAIDRSLSSFVLYELPLVVAAVCCFLLRWRSPEDR